MAEIQALLPNGTYRAIVAQRDITLALPFSAKPGDSLELEVVETDGKVALAFVANRSVSAGAAAQNSVPTTLSQTGKLIGDLLGGIDNQGKRAPPAALNGSRPLVESMPTTASDLAPVLKQALTQSGMFYEAHQARWVAGELPTSNLLQEPQGQLSQTQIAALKDSALGTLTAGNSSSTEASSASKSQQSLQGQSAAATPSEMHSPQGARAELAYAQQASLQEAPAQLASQGDQGASRTANTAPQLIPPQISPLVQQQLDALATQTYAWQGQIWPGQQMSWEISEDQGGRQQDSEAGNSQWQTRLKLTLPQLGGVEASLRLRPGNEIEISLTVDQGSSGSTLDAASQSLKQQFAAAGLNLSQFSVKHDAPAE